MLKGETMPLTRFGHDQNGSALAEVTVLIPIIFIFLLGAVDFLFAFYQWNAAAKAVETGARIAALIDPVSGRTQLDNLSTSPALLGNFGVNFGDPWPSAATYTVKCDGNTATCTCTGACIGWAAGYDQNAMNWIVFGRGQQNGCGDAASYYFAGMCDIFGRIAPANVVVTYTQSGLGFVGRRPVPTVTVALQNMPFHFFFLGGLLSFGNINIPAQATTETGEALSSAQP
jgi:Flp pilus assembly pilin Flp